MVDNNYRKNELLLLSIRQKNDALVANLLNENLNLSYQDEFKCDALYYSVALQQYEVTKMLIAKGADWNAKYERGKNILQIAIQTDCERKGGIDIIKFLLDLGINVNYKDKLGNTALSYACISYTVNLNTIELLLRKGADIHLANNFGVSPYSSAKDANQKELLSILTNNTP